MKCLCQLHGTEILAPAHVVYSSFAATVSSNRLVSARVCVCVE